MNANWANRSQSGRFGLYRNTRGGWIAGVCCGIADRLAIKPVWVRGGFILLSTVGHGIPAILLYIAGVLLLEPRSVNPGFDGAAAWGSPGNGPAGPGPAGPGYFADRFYRGGMRRQDSAPVYGPAQSGALAPLAARFAALDARLNNIEAAVTSDELSLRRKFRDLGG